MITTNFGPKIAAALVAAQAEMKAVTKDGTNPAFHSSFVTLDALIDAVRPVLAQHGLAIAQGATHPTTDENGRVTAFVGETIVMHESGEWLLSTLVMPLAKSDPQGLGSAVTYFRRYSLSSMLGINTEEDDDAEAATVRPTQRSGAKAGGANSTPATPTRATQEEPCPKCGGRMWDNRETKKNARQPDYKCRDAKCDGVIWPPKAGKKELAGVGPGFDEPPLEDYS